MAFTSLNAKLAMRLSKAGKCALAFSLLGLSALTACTFQPWSQNQALKTAAPKKQPQALENTLVDKNTLAQETPLDKSALIAEGRSSFIRCVGCHSLTPDENAELGPHLSALVGRKVASVDGFTYTEAVQALDFTWTRERLLSWLEKPQELVPDMCLPFTGITSEEEREALLVFIEQH